MSISMEDLRVGEFLGCICDSCGHASTVPVLMILQRVSGSMPINELGDKLRCQKCDTLGDVIVDARRALGHL